MATDTYGNFSPNTIVDKWLFPVRRTASSCLIPIFSMKWIPSDSNPATKISGSMSPCFLETGGVDWNGT